MVDFERVTEQTTFCNFLGLPHSGTSIVGAILDAHPKAIVSHQYMALRNMLRGESFEDVVCNVMEMSEEQTQGQFGRRSCNKWGRSYDLNMSRQGTADGDLLMVGDKGGFIGLMSVLGGSRRALQKMFDTHVLGMSHCQVPTSLSDIVRLRLKESLDKIALLAKPHSCTYVVVMRNPFDVLATTSRNRREQDVTLTWNEQIQNLMYERYVMYCALQILVDELSEFKTTVIALEDLIANPESTLIRLMNGVGLPVDEEHMACSIDKLFKKPQKRRNEVRWDAELIERVEWVIQTFPLLSQYSFEN